MTSTNIYQNSIVVPPNIRGGLTGTWTGTFNAGKGVLQAAKTAAAESATWAVAVPATRLGDMMGQRPHTVRLKANIGTAALSGNITCQLIRTNLSATGNIVAGTPVACTVTRSDGLTTAVSATDIEITATCLDALKLLANDGYDAASGQFVPSMESYFVFTFPSAATTAVIVYAATVVSDTVSG